MTIATRVSSGRSLAADAGAQPEQAVNIDNQGVQMVLRHLHDVYETICGSLRPSYAALELPALADPRSLLRTTPEPLDAPRQTGQLDQRVPEPPNPLAVSVVLDEERHEVPA